MENKVVPVKTQQMKEDNALIIDAVYSEEVDHRHYILYIKKMESHYE